MPALEQQETHTADITAEPQLAELLNPESRGRPIHRDRTQSHSESDSGLHILMGRKNSSYAETGNRSTVESPRAVLLGCCQNAEDR